MTEKQIVAVDRLVLSADALLADAVGHWEGLDREPLLNIGDKLNEINQRSQLAIGAWLIVYADERGYGALTDLAERWGRKPQTLRSWKHTYLKIQNVEHAQHFPFGKVQELARIPAEVQRDWLEPVAEMKRAELRAAITAAKKAKDWTRPLDIAPVSIGSPPIRPDTGNDTARPGNGAHAALHPVQHADNGAEPCPDHSSKTVSAKPAENPMSDEDESGDKPSEMTVTREPEPEPASPEPIPHLILEAAHAVMVGFVESRADEYVARLEVSSSEWMTIADDSLSYERERELLTSAAAMCLWQEWMVWYLSADTPGSGGLYQRLDRFCGAYGNSK